MRSDILKIGSFVGGEASIFPTLEMPQKFSVKMQNCHIAEGGGVSKIPGYSRVNINQLGFKIASGFEYRKKDGTVIVLASGNGRVMKLVGDSLTDIKTGLDSTAKIWFAQFNDLCVFGNGVDVPYKYDGTTVSVLGGLPVNTKFIKPHTHIGRIWWTDSVNKMMAFHSAREEAEDYTEAANAGYIDFSFVLPQGDELLDIVTYVDLIVFFFRNHIAIYSGSNPTASGDFSLVQLIAGVGVVATGAVLPIGTDLLFIHHTGIKSLKQIVSTGSMTIGDLSTYEAPTIQREIASGILSGNPFAAAHYPQKGWSCFLINEQVWLYSYVWKAWARMVGADVFGLFNLVSGGMYMCGTGLLYNYGNYWSFDQNAINMQWESPWIRYSSKGLKGYPKILEIMFGRTGGTPVEVMISHDFNTVMRPNIQTVLPGASANFMDSPLQDTWDESFYMDNQTEYQAVRIPAFGSGKAVQIIFSNITTQGPIEWNSIAIQGVIGRML